MWLLGVTCGLLAGAILADTPGRGLETLRTDLANFAIPSAATTASTSSPRTRTHRNSDADDRQCREFSAKNLQSG